VRIVPSVLQFRLVVHVSAPAPNTLTHEPATHSLWYILGVTRPVMHIPLTHVFVQATVFVQALFALHSWIQVAGPPC